MAQCECLAFELGLQKIVLERKKSFKLKLRKNSHKVIVDYCYKSPVALQVTAKEVMTFFIFLEISTISGYITRFPRSLPEKW